MPGRRNASICFMPVCASSAWPGISEGTTAAPRTGPDAAAETACGAAASGGGSPARPMGRVMVTESWEDCAFTVLGTVVSTAVPGQAVVDCGAKALGREPMRGTGGEGFAALLDRPEVVVTKMSEEHGILDLSQTSWRPVVGEMVRLVPNHVCIVVHLNDTIVGVRGDQVETSWPVAARGR